MSRLTCTHAIALSLLIILAALLSCTTLFYLQKFNLTLLKEDASSETVIFLQQDHWPS